MTILYSNLNGYWGDSRIIQMWICGSGLNIRLYSEQMNRNKIVAATFWLNINCYLKRRPTLSMAMTCSHSVANLSINQRNMCRRKNAPKTQRWASRSCHYRDAKHCCPETSRWARAASALHPSSCRVHHKRRSESHYTWSATFGARSSRNEQVRPIFIDLHLLHAAPFRARENPSRTRLISLRHR